MARYRNALILLGVFVVLLVVVLVIPNGKSNSSPVTAATTPTPNPNAAQLQLLNIPTSDAATKIELKQDSPAKTLAFKYENTKWLQDAPGGMELDTIAVASTVGQLSTLKGNSLITDKGDNLANYGLDKPGLVITLTSPTQGAKVINIGQQNPATQAYYVKLENDPRVVTVSSTLVDQLKGWFSNLPVLPPTPTAFPTIPLSPLPTTVPASPGAPGGASLPETPTPAPVTASTTTSSSPVPAPSPSPTP